MMAKLSKDFYFIVDPFEAFVFFEESLFEEDFRSEELVCSLTLHLIDFSKITFANLFYDLVLLPKIS